MEITFHMVHQGSVRPKKEGSTNACSQTYRGEAADNVGLSSYGAHKCEKRDVGSSTDEKICEPGDESGIWRKQYGRLQPLRCLRCGYRPP